MLNAGPEIRAMDKNKTTGKWFFGSNIHSDVVDKPAK